MQKVFDFLAENPLQFCATVGRDGLPKVRPFQMMFHEDGKLYFCTGAQKEVYAELLKQPRVEICASSMTSWLRIRGRVEWVEDRKIREKTLNASPLVKSIYRDADNPVFKVFYIADAQAVLADFSGNPPESFELCR